MTHRSDRRTLILAGIAALALSACQPDKSVDLPPGVPLDIKVLASGHVLWNNERIDLRELKHRADLLAEKAPHTVVQVSGEEKVSYGDFMKVMSNLQLAGLDNVGIVGGT